MRNKILSHEYRVLSSAKLHIPDKEKYKEKHIVYEYIK